MTEMQAKVVNKRVLVAEDEYFIAKGLARHLRAVGAEVVGPVATVADALGLVEAERLDGAVLDINLRGEFVFSVADALIARGVPFIFATGYGPGVIPKQYDAIARCEKPAEPQDLILKLFDSRAGSLVA